MEIGYQMQNHKIGTNSELIYLTAEETHIIQYPFNTRNPYQILP